MSSERQVTQIRVPQGCNNIIIFVHGFGVRYDSRGLFTEIAGNLPNDYGYVLFDFYESEGQDVYITSIAQQTQRLQEVIENIQTSYPDSVIHIIAHSKGCIITSLLQPKISGHIMFLAPPEKFGTDLETYFTRYRGAIKTKKELIIPRKDGTISHIPLSYFKESRKIDAQKVMTAYAIQQKIELIQTINDEVLGKTNYAKLKNNPNVSITPIDADHNFMGNSRAILIEKIHKLLS